MCKVSFLLFLLCIANIYCIHLSDFVLCVNASVNSSNKLFRVNNTKGNVNETKRQYKVELVQIVHRHGARSASVKFNQSKICGIRYPCGELNSEGIEMMFNVGRFLRKRYCNETVAVVGNTSINNAHEYANRDRYSSIFSSPEFFESSYLPLCSYNNSEYYIRSTDYSRTIQSAGAIVAGWFTNEDSLKSKSFSVPPEWSSELLSWQLPVIHTVDRSTDTLLSTEANPVLRTKYSFGLPERRKLCEPIIDAELSVSTIALIAFEVHAEGYCAAYTNRLACVETLSDIADAFEATGELVHYPTLSKHFNALRRVRMCAMEHVFVYNRDNEEHARQGSFAQVLLRTLVNNMLTSKESSEQTSPHHNETSNIKIYQYSTHDTALITLASTLEATLSINSILPPFGTTYLFELLSSNVASSLSPSELYQEEEEKETLFRELEEEEEEQKENSSTSRHKEWFVRIVRGHPSIAPESAHTFQLESFEFKCMSSNNNAIYIPTDATCPLTDFIRFIAYNEPQTKAGLCAIGSELMKRMNCPADAANDTRSLSLYCKWFRVQCPAYACDVNHYLSAIDYNCYAYNKSFNNADHEHDINQDEQGFHHWPGYILIIYCVVIGLCVLLL